MVNSSGESLEDCLQLLKGDGNDQLSGLIMVTKLCNQGDHDAIRSVYDAIGPELLHLMLRSGKGTGGQNREAFLQVSVAVLAAFCRVPEIAASEHILSVIPLIPQIMLKVSGSSVVGDCLEILVSVSDAQENSLKLFYMSGGMQLLASQLFILPDDFLEMALKLVQMIISKLPSEKVYTEHPSELATIVVAISQKFGSLHSALKFEALHALSLIFFSTDLLNVDEALKLKDVEWANNIRSGVVAILHNKIVPEEKLIALMLADRVMSIIGEEWLFATVNIPDVQDPIPPDRCILLFLETLRVEIAVLLNDLAYLRYEASSSNMEGFPVKQRYLGITFSLIEKIIKLVSKSSASEDSNSSGVVDERTIMKIILGLNETIIEVLRYLEDGKEHAQNKGDDFLACVRVIGSYLAEAPDAGGEKLNGLIEYMLSVQGNDENSPLSSIRFLLPMLCQITMKSDGCQIIASSGSYKSIIEYLISLISENSGGTNSISLTFDTILNFLVEMQQIGFELKDSSFLKLVLALSNWTVGINDPSVYMMPASICAVILDSFCEEDLLTFAGFRKEEVVKVSQLMKKSLGYMGQEEADLLDIIEQNYACWAERFPTIKEFIEK